MTETAEAGDLLLRAKRLSAVARAKRDNEDAAQTQGQVSTAIHRLNTALLELDSRLRIHRSLADLGADVAPVTGLTRSASSLRDHVQGVGRPTAQFLNARSKDVSLIVAATNTEDVQAWRTWAMGRTLELDEESIPTFGAHALRARERIRDLRDLASKDPTVANITLFKVGLDGARDALASLAEAVNTDDLMTRIAAGTVTLADLSDADVAELRADVETARQIRLGIS
jgi:hypothetical protein